MKNQVNQMRAGVYLSFANLLLSSLIPMIYTPWMLRLLGIQEHGLYALAQSAVGYLGLLNLGLGSTLIRYLSKYRAEQDRQSVSRTFGLFLMLYSVMGVLALLGGKILAANAGQIFSRTLLPQEAEKMEKLLLIMAANTAVSFPAGVFSSVQTSHERYVFRHGMNILSTVTGPVYNLAALYMGRGALGMAWMGLVMQVIMLVPNVYYCFRVLKIRPSFTGLPLKLLGEMLSFSAFVFLATVADMLFWATDKVILGMAVGTAAVSVYQIGSTFNQMVMQLSSSISGVLTPRITAMVVKNASASDLTELFVRVGRIQFLVVGLVVTGFAAFGQSFIRLWVGDDYAEAYWIAVMTLFPLCIPLIQNTGLSILVAQNRHKFRSVLFVLIAAVNAVSTYLLVPSMGGIGAALCSCVSFLLGQGLVMNWYYHSIVGIDIPLFWRNILKMAVLPGVMMGLTLLLQRLRPIESWPVFFAGVGVYTALYCLGMYLTAMNDYEKDVIRGPLKKAAGFFRRK